MNEENANSTGESGSRNHDRAEAAFCEKLLSCYRCGKIYFSKQPIGLRTRSRRKLHVCLECSLNLECSACGKPVTPATTLLVENIPDSPAGFLCIECKKRVFLGLRPPPQSIWARLRSAVSSAAGSALGFFRQMTGVNIRFRRKRP